MGWDRVRFFETLDEQTGKPNATLISADKESSRTVYGKDFSTFLRCLGYRATQVIDTQEAPKAVERAIQFRPKDRTVLERFSLKHVIDFPDTARADWYGSPTATHAVEVQPPIEGRDMGVITNYLMQYCEPSDAGPLFLDHRNGQNGHGFRAGTIGADRPPQPT